MQMYNLTISVVNMSDVLLTPNNLFNVSPTDLVSYTTMISGKNCITAIKWHLNL